MFDRSERLAVFADQPGVSVLIIGAGINGAALFRDLALQGVDVLLVDKGDYCSAASAASSRMIHGGLRYLEFGEFRLVRESLKERNLLMRNAPHYVTPLRTTIPVMKWLSGMWHCTMRFTGLGGNRPANRGALMVKIGLTFYDVFTRKMRMTPRHYFTSRAKTLEKRPGLDHSLVCSATYYDGAITYPERLGLALILDAEAACDRARALSYVSAESAEGGAVTLRDTISDTTFAVRPTIVVNATGGWIDLTNARLGHPTEVMGGTKGAHLILDNDALYEALDGDMVYYETKSGRVSVALPWLGRPLIGATDIRVDDPDEVRCTDEEIDYIIASIREIFPNLDVNRSQIISYFTGVRPLPKAEGSTLQVSRDHSCPILEPGNTLQFPVYSMIGGKWTTFRAFAEQVCDKVLARLGRSRNQSTETLAIGGGADFPEGDGRAAWLSRLVEKTGVAPDRAEALLERYGTKAAAFAAQDGEPLDTLPGYTRTEIERIVTQEHVTHLTDLVLRRTALALLGELDQPRLAELAAITAASLGWDSARRANEIEQTMRILRERYGVDLTGKA